MLPARVNREVAVAGVVRINAPAGTLARLVQDIENFERGEGFLATRRLSNPPSVEDFATFRLPAEDLTALRSCRPGRCAVKLGQGTSICSQR